jgi:WhiB family redox-sensing transcriptional regulator
MLSNMSWRQNAACLGKPAHLFFGSDTETSKEQQQREAVAKAICAVCPVVEPCLEEGRYEEGIWGGLTVGERRGRRRLHIVLERPIVMQENEPVGVNPWTVIETNGTHAIWQRDTNTTWHGFEWGIARKGILTTVHDDLNEAYVAYGRLLE